MKYQENHKFSHPILWMLMLGLVVFFGYGIVQQIILDQPFGSRSAPDHWLIISALLVIGVCILLLTARLSFTIDEQGIHYRFTPFHLTSYTLPWSEIEQVQLRRYRAFREFGGWGIRVNLKGNKAYNVMNDHGQGMEVVKTNGKKILFSVHNPQEISSFLQKLSHKGEGITLQN